MTAQIAQDAPPPDPAGAADLNQQAAQADQAEKEVLVAANASGPAADEALPAPPPTASVSIDKGQTTGQVQSALGPPAKVVNLGTKTIYIYKDMKVTFVNGKVTDIE